MFQYFRNILPLIDSLSCNLQAKVNIIGYRAAGVLKVFKMAAKLAAILDILQIQLYR